MNSATTSGGKAAAVPARARRYCPKDFSNALEEAGVYRSAKWVRLQMKAGKIKTVSFLARKLIPESELFRILGIKEASR